MATFQTRVLWSRAPLTNEEYQKIQEYIATQTPTNGILVSQPDGSAVRIWDDEASANAFAAFARTLQTDQKFPTTVIVTAVA